MTANRTIKHSKANFAFYDLQENEVKLTADEEEFLNHFGFQVGQKASRVPLRAEFMPARWTAFLPRIMVIGADYENDTNELRSLFFRLMGTNCVTFYAGDYTGKPMSALPSETASKRGNDGCQLVIDCKGPVVGVSSKLDDDLPYLPTRTLLLPFSVGGDRIDQIMVLLTVGRQANI